MTTTEDNRVSLEKHALAKTQIDQFKEKKSLEILDKTPMKSNSQQLDEMYSCDPERKEISFIENSSSQGNWIACEKELPLKDGSYEICNHPELENDALKRELTTTAYYDGYGFQWLGVYRIPKYWRKYEMNKKKYGKT